MNIQRNASASFARDDFDMVITQELVDSLRSEKSTFAEKYPDVRSVYIDAKADVLAQLECHLLWVDSYSKYGGFFESHHSLEKVVFDPNWKCSGKTSMPLAGMFENCHALKEVYLPHSLEIIDGKAFWNCTSLTEIQLPEALKKIRALAFGGCTVLRKIHFPDSLQEIERRAFEGCESLTEICLPRTLTDLGERAFDACAKLRSLTILSEHMNVLDFSAVQDCIALEEFVICNPQNVEYIRELPPERFWVRDSQGFVRFETFLIKYTGKDVDVVVPEDIVYLCPQCFSGKKKIRSVILSENTKVIDHRAFVNSGIERCEAPGVIWVMEGAFANTNLRNIELPCLEKMGMQVFKGCKQMEKVLFPNELSADMFSETSWRLFADCENLSEIQGVLPFKEIGRETFYNCSRLEQLELSDGVKVIRTEAFKNCLLLKEVRLPSSLEIIENKAFFQTGLEHLFLPDEIQTISPKAAPDVKLIVRDGSTTRESCTYSHCRCVLRSQFETQQATDSKQSAPTKKKEEQATIYEGAERQLRYLDLEKHLYSAEEGRRRFFPFSQGKSARVDAALSITYTVKCNKTPEFDGNLPETLQNQEVALIRWLGGGASFSSVWVCDAHGVRLGEINDPTLAYYLDLGYVKVEKVEVVQEKKASVETVRRKCSPKLELQIEYTHSGRKEKTEITAVGTFYYVSALEKLKVGDQVIIQREMDNQYSSNAIAVYDDRGEMCGHIPESTAQAWAPLMDSGEMRVSGAEVISCSAAISKEVGLDIPVEIDVKVTFVYDSEQVFAADLKNHVTVRTVAGNWKAEIGGEYSPKLFAYYKDSVIDFLLAFGGRLFSKKGDENYETLKEYEYDMRLITNDAICKLLNRKKLFKVWPLGINESYQVHIRCFCENGFDVDGVDGTDEFGMSLVGFKGDYLPCALQDLNWNLMSWGRPLVKE